MKYNKGKKMFYNNKRTGGLFDVEIIDVKYIFNRKIGQTDALTEEQIDEFIEQGKLSETKESYINKRIKDLESELGIKLERK